MTPKDFRESLYALPSNLNELSKEEQAEVLHEDREKRAIAVGACRICRLHGQIKIVFTYCGKCHDFCCDQHMGWSAHRPHPLCHVCGMKADEREQKGLVLASHANRPAARNPDPSEKG